MGSVIKVHHFSRKTLALFAVFFMYFVAGSAFFYFGFQPTVSAGEVYAKEAEKAEASLVIPAISLDIPVVEVKLNGQELEVPEQIAGSYSVHQNKTLLIGHSSTAFSNLTKLNLSDQIIYQKKSYQISDIEIAEKSSISMKTILQAEEKDTIILMTCTGEHLSGNDYSHRLIITATANV